MTPARHWIIAGIDAYRARGGGRTLFGVDCNFEPSCSAYTREAVLRHGVVMGLILGWRRIRRCTDRDAVHRLADPVPVVLPRRPWFSRWFERP